MATYKCKAATSASYTMPGPNAPSVQDRQFEVGEHVNATENPDPNCFEEVANNGN